MTSAVCAQLEFTSIWGNGHRFPSFGLHKSRGESNTILSQDLSTCPLSPSRGSQVLPVLELSRQAPHRPGEPGSPTLLLLHRLPSHPSGWLCVGRGPAPGRRAGAADKLWTSLSRVGDVCSVGTVPVNTGGGSSPRPRPGAGKPAGRTPHGACPSRLGCRWGDREDETAPAGKGPPPPHRA